jgi:hypothetical protein
MMLIQNPVMCIKIPYIYPLKMTKTRPFFLAIYPTVVCENKTDIVEAVSNMYVNFKNKTDRPLKSVDTKKQTRSVSLKIW